MSQAEKYLEELDYENAEAFYLSAIEIDPKKKEPYLKLSDIYIAEEEFDKAVEILELAEVVQAEDDEMEMEDVTKRKEELMNCISYEWVLEPAIEADDIYYVALIDDNQYSFNERCRQFESPYAVIEKDGALGLIDAEGEIPGGMNYTREQ